MTQSVAVGTRTYSETLERTGPSYQAYQILHLLFVVVPLVGPSIVLRAFTFEF